MYKFSSSVLSCKQCTIFWVVTVVYICVHQYMVVHCCTRTRDSVPVVHQLVYLVCVQQCTTVCLVGYAGNNVRA